MIEEMRMYRSLLLAICVAAFLQLCLAQDRCEVISAEDRASKDRELKENESRDNAMAVKSITNPVRRISRRRPRVPRKLAAPLAIEAKVANDFARKFVFPLPKPNDICKQERRDIVLSSWMNYRGYFCYVPPPFSSYRFFHIHCPCCTPCNIPGNPCGFYLCLPEVKRTYTVPGFCWRRIPRGRRTFWRRVGWIKMTFITYQACCCKRILFSASSGR